MWGFTYFRNNTEISVCGGRKGISVIINNANEKNTIISVSDVKNTLNCIYRSTSLFTREITLPNDVGISQDADSELEKRYKVIRDVADFENIKSYNFERILLTNDNNDTILIALKPLTTLTFKEEIDISNPNQTVIISANDSSYVANVLRKAKKMESGLNVIELKEGEHRQI